MGWQKVMSSLKEVIEQLKSATLLQSLPIPEGTWESINLDFIMQLSMSSNMHYDALWL